MISDPLEGLRRGHLAEPSIESNTLALAPEFLDSLSRTLARIQIPLTVPSGIAVDGVGYGLESPGHFCLSWNALPYGWQPLQEWMDSTLLRLESLEWKSVVDLEELVKLVELPDPLFQWCLDTETMKVTLPDWGDDGQLPPQQLLLPTLTEDHILGWMTSFTGRNTGKRISGPLGMALKHPMPICRFHEVLSVNPQAQGQWEEYFYDQRLHLVLDWLRAHGWKRAAFNVPRLVKRSTLL